MRTFSRNMPPAPEPPRSLGTYIAFGVAGLMGAGLIYLLLTELVIWVVLSAVLTAGFVFSRLQDRRLRRLAAERQGEDLCSFVRAFSRRTVDPWILRAVYEELQPYCTFRGGILPLRPDDRLKEDLRIDGEELDYLALDVARRCWRSMEDSESNRYFGRVETARDFIDFLSHQPSLLRGVA